MVHALSLRGHCVTVATAQRRQRQMTPSLLGFAPRKCRNYLHFGRGLSDSSAAPMVHATLVYSIVRASVRRARRNLERLTAR